MDLVPVDAFGETVEHARPLAQRVDDPGTDRQVVVDEIELGLAALGEVDAVRIRQTDVEAVHVDLHGWGLAGRGGHGPTLFRSVDTTQGQESFGLPISATRRTVVGLTTEQEPQ